MCTNALALLLLGGGRAAVSVSGGGAGKGRKGAGAGMVGMSEGRDNDISVKQARRCRAAAEVWPSDQATAVKSKFPGWARCEMRDAGPAGYAF